MKNKTAIALTLFCLLGAGFTRGMQLESLLRSEGPALQAQESTAETHQNDSAKNEKSTNAQDVAAGTYRPGAGTLIVGELIKPLEAKKLKLGDVVECRLTQDLLFKGKIIIPKKAKAQGHITEIVLSSKGQQGSRVGLVFDKVVLPDKKKLPFEHPAIIVAVAAPIRGATVQTTKVTDLPVQMSKGKDTGSSVLGAIDANAQLAGANMSSASGVISAANRGVIGIKDVGLDNSNPAYSVIVSPRGNLRLDFDVQVVLQVTSIPKP